MRRWTIICALGLAGCGATDPRPTIPPEMLTPCPGWQGRVPETQGELLRASLAEKTGRLCANEKLRAVGEVVGQG